MKTSRKRWGILWGGLLLAIPAVAYAASFFWPAYDWALRLPSPDLEYDVVVLRGDKAAFDDLFYNVYVFPRADAPKEQIKGDRVWMAGRWRSDRFLVYSGYGYPMLHWTGAKVLEIDVSDLYPSVTKFDPIKRFSGSEMILTSLVFKKTDSRNVGP